VERKELGLICFCYILMKIIEGAHGFRYQPRSEAFARYIALGRSFKKYPAETHVQFMEIARQCVRRLKEEGVHEHLHKRLSGKGEIANHISFGEKDWTELAILWMKHHLSTKTTRFSTMRNDVQKMAKSLGISYETMAVAMHALLKELADDFLKASVPS